jgi:hypothetical protein
MRRRARIDCRPRERMWSLSSVGSAGDDIINNRLGTEDKRLTFGKGLRCWPAVYKCPEYGHCAPSRSLVEEHYCNEELPWVVRDTFWITCRAENLKASGEENIPCMRRGLALRRRS